MDDRTPCNYETIEEIASHLRALTTVRPTVGLICGSGLGGLADSVDDADIFHYKDIPHFPVSTVIGHAGRLVFGRLRGKEVVCMQGRFHPYEGHSLSKCTLPVRVMKAMGVETLVITNAAGALNRQYRIGDFMVLNDHINLPGLAGQHPLVGLNDERLGVRFPPLADAYDGRLRAFARKVGRDLGLEARLREGCYVMQTGPTFETIGEARMMVTLGGDAAGMSTVHEVIVARHGGMRVLAMSLITNLVVQAEGGADLPDGHAVLAESAKASHQLKTFVERIVELM